MKQLKKGQKYLTKIFLLAAPADDNDDDDDYDDDDADDRYGMKE